MNLLCVTWGSQVRLIQGEMERNSEYCGCRLIPSPRHSGQPWLAGTNSCWSFSCRKFLCYIPLLIIPNATPQLCILHTPVCFTHLAQPHHTGKLPHRGAFPLLGALGFSGKDNLIFDPSQQWHFTQVMGLHPFPGILTDSQDTGVWPLQNL